MVQAPADFDDLIELPLFAAAPELVGRDRERDALIGSVLRTPALVTIEGEPGVGKTRLIRELIDFGRSNDLPVLVGHCHPVREPFPLGPVIEALRQHEVPPDIELSPVIGAVRPFLPELSHLLPAAPDALSDAAADRHRVLRGVIALLEAFSPAVLVLEDLHWIDEFTCDFLSLLMANIPEGIAVVVTYRRKELPEPSPLLELISRGTPGVLRTGLSLGPLDVEGVKSLIGSILATHEVSDSFASYLHERTAGLPFAVEEVLKLLQERRDLLLQDGRWIRRTLDSIEVPTKIRDSVLERHYRLSDKARCVVEAAAVLGEPSSEEALIATSGAEPAVAREGLNEALSAVLLEEGEAGLYGFRHALASQSVYESIPTPLRRDLHLRAGNFLEGSSPLPLSSLVTHFQEAGATDKWTRYAESAADLAVSLHDEKGACRYLREAVSAPSIPAEERGRLAIKFGYAALHGLAHNDAIDVLTEIIETADVTAPVRGELRYFLSGLLSQSGQMSAAREQDRLSIPELEEKPALLARALTGLAFTQVPDESVERNLEWLKKAVDTAARVADPVARVSVAVDEASILLDIGEPRAWELIEAIEQRGTGDEELKQVARGYANYAQAALFLGHSDRAKVFVTAGEELCSQLGYDRFDIDFEVDRALLDWAAGRWDGLVERAKDLAERAEGCPTVRFKALMIHTALLFSHGEFDQCEAILHEMASTAWDSGAPEPASWAAARSTLIQLIRGDAANACAIGRAAVERVRRKGNWVVTFELVPASVRALLASGAIEEAEGLAEEVRLKTEGRDAPAIHSAVLLSRGLIAAARERVDESARAFQEAHASLRDIPRTYEATIALEERGKLGFEDDLVAALQGFETLEASFDAARVRREIRERGIALPYPWRGGRRGYGIELSPREREVAVLAAEGRTNREIAEALFLSPKTVGHHLASAMKKLGVGSRRDIRQALTEADPA